MPFSGKFVVRLSPEAHRKAYLAARRAGQSLNAWVNDALNEKLSHQSSPKETVVARPDRRTSRATDRARRSRIGKPRK